MGGDVVEGCKKSGDGGLSGGGGHFFVLLTLQKGVKEKKLEPVGETGPKQRSHSEKEAERVSSS